MEHTTEQQERANQERIKELEHILGGWLFAPVEAYNYFTGLHNEWCDLKNRPWEKKSQRPADK